MRRALAAVLLLLATAPAAAHDVERAEQLLGEIATHRRAAVEAGAESERAAATFRLGEATQALVEALNRDVAAHGARELFPELVVRRLQAHGLAVAWAPAQGRYVYDLAAFTEYLRRAPRGPWAADATFQLLAGRFHARLGPDPATLVGADVDAVLAAIGAAEAFLRSYPSHPRAGTVRFFLAVDHYRVARNAADPAVRHQHGRRAGQALREIAERSADTFEVRAAQILLEQLAAEGPSR